MRTLLLAFAVLAAGMAHADNATPAQAGVVSLSVRDGSVTYHIVHKLHRVDGTSKRIEGRARLQAGGPVQVAIRIPVETFDSGNVNRDAHMKEAVEAATYPHVELKAVLDGLTAPATFPSTVQKTFRGQLTFHGITQPLELPITLRFDAPDRVVATASFTVSLDAYKVERPSLMFVKIDDAMKVDAQLSFAP